MSSSLIPRAKLEAEITNGFVALVQPPTCGSCRFGHLVPQDLKQRACFGVPPTPIVMAMQGPLTQQGVAVQMLRPMVEAVQTGCALWAAGTPK